MEIFILIILTHWVADFIFQREVDALKKSSDFWHLFRHTTTYSFVWAIVILTYITITLEITGIVFSKMILFVLITFVFHTITDYFTNRVVKTLFGWENGHGGIFKNTSR